MRCLQTVERPVMHRLPDVARPFACKSCRLVTQLFWAGCFRMYTPVSNTEVCKSQPWTACNSGECSPACTISSATRQTSRLASAARMPCWHEAQSVTTFVAFEGRLHSTHKIHGMGTAFSNDSMRLKITLTSCDSSRVCQVPKLPCLLVANL